MIMKLKMSDGCQIDYQVGGEGKSLIFVHGWAASKNFWKFQTEFFKEKYKVITFDLRGHGDSCKNTKLSVDMFVSDLEELISSLKIKDFVLVGHSLGTMISMIYTYRHPEDVKGLILIGAFSKVDKSVKGSIERKFLKFLIKHARTQAAKLTRKTLFHPDTPEEIINFVMQESSKTPVEKVIECMDAIEQTDITDIIPKIKAPVLLVYGETENTISKEVQRYLIEKLNVKKTVIVPRAGHNAMLENPRIVNKEIENFLIQQLNY